MGRSTNKTAPWMHAISLYARRPFRPERMAVRTALIVVDMQRFFVDPAGSAFLPDSRGALPHVKLLLEVFRAAGLPIIFTRHEDRPGDAAGAMGRWWGSTMEPGDPELEIAAEVAPLHGERVIRKHQYSAFHGTGLAEELRRGGVKGVVVCGVMTHLCCETTARDAFMENFDVTVAADAMAASSEELHLAALKTLANGFAVAASANEIAAAAARR